MIELRKLTKYYSANGARRYILRDVSLVIPSRTNLAVIGPNGAGKSTLLRLIGGAESANKGRIITDADISWPLGLTTGFQGSLSGRKNVEFVCRVNGLDNAQTRDVVAHVIRFAEIGPYFDMPVQTYSSGMRARVNFGLSTAFAFDVYLIDELTSVGDTIFRQKARAAFDEIRSRASLVFVSHNVQTLRESCDSALFLRDGKADFFADIEAGIDAYQEYILERSLSNNLKRLGAKPTPARKAAKKAARKIPRGTVAVRPDGQQPPRPAAKVRPPAKPNEPLEP